jgi:S-formylglutathione hydrolase
LAQSLSTLSEHTCFGGVVSFHEHRSESCNAPMRFAVYLPPQATAGPVPVLYYLAGLTSTEETFTTKAGAQRYATEYALMLVAPDTSPRGLGLSGEDDDWDFGSGAGFYIDATAEPWSDHYKMYTYVTAELPALVEENFPARTDARGIFGHSMGGHGALTLALRHKDRWRSVSAFAPISAPMRCPWGIKAFTGYLGPDRSKWAEHDTTELLKSRGPQPFEILVDQGLADKFLEEQLKPELLEEAAEAAGQKLTLRRHAGYDHSYWFIQTFVADHIAHHAKALKAG